MASIDALPAALQALGRRVVDGSAAALKAHVEDIGTKANAPGVVPYDSGLLHDSQFTEGPLTGAGRSTMRIGYDDAKGHYFLLVHEQPQSARKTGRSKWLESTITANADGLGSHLKRELGL